ncbi:hypothetical protein IFR04_012545 [Cadophora malorum]|uniref:BTB domain-containing protein n=1 Tax=Cadophora malorum TaxID=108018 RepID=A0A8H7W815_9HELO|nr:hypothetical protein IFR04_012545 [Cadophora malorum]
MSSLAHHPALKVEANFARFELPHKIVVGKEKIEFYIPEDVICDVSEFFRAACSQDWESGRTGIVTLENEDPKLFMHFATRITWLSLAPVFQNAVMDNLVSATQSLVNEHNEVGGIAPPTLEFLYEKTDSDSPIRQLVLDVAMMHMDVDEIQHTDIREPFNGDFCKALATYALQYIQSHIGQNGLRPIVPWVSNPLRYYVYQMKKRTIRVG